jgi:hypothetical protein
MTFTFFFQSSLVVLGLYLGASLISTAFLVYLLENK